MEEKRSEEKNEEAGKSVFGRSTSGSAPKISGVEDGYVFYRILYR